jgi:hypothetical protein
MATFRQFYNWDSQDKGRVFSDALVAAGYHRTHSLDAGIYLTDLDIPGRLNGIRKQLENGAKLFVYPHAAHPYIGWDGLLLPSGKTKAAFVFTDGHKEVIRAYGYSGDLHSVGWAYSNIRKFIPRELGSVLFAPIHPNGNGWLSSMDKEINARTYTELLELVEDGVIRLIVRHIKSIASNGLWQDPRVKFLPAEPRVNQNWLALLDPYSLVVSHGTLAYISVALGIPTAMMQESEAPHNGNTDATIKRVASWEKYKHLMMYPHDILQGEPKDVLTRACQTDEDILDWRHRMIGEEVFDANLFVRTMESYL